MATPLHASAGRAQRVEVDDQRLAVHLADGRVLLVPLGWFPRLQQGTAEERSYWVLLAGGTGILWPALDEHVTIDRLLAGRSSTESDASFRTWLRRRHGPGEARPPT